MEMRCLDQNSSVESMMNPETIDIRITKAKISMVQIKSEFIPALTKLAVASSFNAKLRACINLKILSRNLSQKDGKISVFY